MTDMKDRAREYLRSQTQLNGGGLFNCNVLNLILGFAEQETKELQENYKKRGDIITSLENQLRLNIHSNNMKWHDLGKDPDDLPKDCNTMCICLGDFGSKYVPVPQVCVGYCDSLGWSDYMGSSLYNNVRYWCELPKQEVKE